MHTHTSFSSWLCSSAQLHSSDSVSKHSTADLHRIFFRFLSLSLRLRVLAHPIRTQFDYDSGFHLKIYFYSEFLFSFPKSTYRNFLSGSYSVVNNKLCVGVFFHSYVSLLGRWLCDFFGGFLHRPKTTMFRWKFTCKREKISEKHSKRLFVTLSMPGN